MNVTADNGIRDVELYIDGVLETEATYDSSTGKYVATIYPNTIGDGQHTFTVIVIDANDISSDANAGTANVEITIETIRPAQPFNMHITDHTSLEASISWSPSTTNTNGSDLSDLAGYNAYAITERSRCDNIDNFTNTDLVCDITGNELHFSGPNISYSGTDYISNPFGDGPVWVDINEQSDPIFGLSAGDNILQITGSHIYVYTIHILPARNDDIPFDDYYMTVYSPNSWYEIVDWTESLVNNCILAVADVGVHSVACRRNGDSYETQSFHLKSIPVFDYEKINDTLIPAVIDPTYEYIFPYNIQPETMIAITAVDEYGNESKKSNWKIVK